MENRSWTVTYRNRDNGQRITCAVFALDRQEAQEKAGADGQISGCEVWAVESVEPHEETLARILISEFAEKQQGGHFACPRCGRMTMDAECVTRNALSRRATVYVCDACGTQEALEDMMDSRMPLAEWAIAQDAEAWRMKVLELHHLGRDSWDRPVYECDGRLYVDVDPRRSRQPDICTKQGNAFDGEPCDPIPEDAIVEFVPERDTWPF